MLVVRLLLGTVMVAHAAYRWANLDAEIAFANEYGLNWFFVWLAMIFEAVGGGLIALGLGTVALGFFVIVYQGLVISYIKVNNGIYLTNGGWEYNAALAALGLVCLMYGSGRLGLDQIFFRRREHLESANDSIIEDLEQV
ncbi:MAG: hypothetical protein CSA83_01115 [Actinomycetales bacterium]|nr:MAG: hypothetical protein CSA83_01115 [Actinomycetales bacterium]